VSRQKRNFGSLLGPNRGAAPSPEAERAGRRVGKRSNSEDVQVGAHIPKELYRQVERRLLDEERDLGELMTELLQGYVTR
jgi:hypothetical protein